MKIITGFLKGLLVGVGSIAYIGLMIVFSALPLVLAFFVITWFLGWW